MKPTAISIVAAMTIDTRELDTITVERSENRVVTITMNRPHRKNDIIDAKEAQDMGLVNRVLPDDQLDAFTDDWADRLAAGPPIALAMTKRLLDNSLNVTFEEALDDEGLSQTVNFSTRDTAEAMQAFVEKRAAHFEGR